MTANKMSRNHDINDHLQVGHLGKLRSRISQFLFFVGFKRKFITYSSDTGSHCVKNEIRHTISDGQDIDI